MELLSSASTCLESKSPVIYISLYFFFPFFKVSWARKWRSSSLKLFFFVFFPFSVRFFSLGENGKVSFTCILLVLGGGAIHYNMMDMDRWGNDGVYVQFFFSLFYQVMRQGANAATMAVFSFCLISLINYFHPMLVLMWNFEGRNAIKNNECQRTAVARIFQCVSLCVKFHAGINILLRCSYAFPFHLRIDLFYKSQAIYLFYSTFDNLKLKGRAAEYIWIIFLSSKNAFLV